jgi:dTDP-4-dehydrorhamnose reductase
MAAEEKILVVGSEGMIGGSLAAHLAGHGRTVVRTARTPGAVGEAVPLDLSSDPSSWTVPDDVSVAYLCAAVTSLDRCRQHPVETRAVNVSATLHLAEMLLRKGAFVVCFSSNLVFDGSVAFEKADAAHCPRTEYGRQKAEMEKGLLNLGRRVCIIRFTKVMGPGDRLLTQWQVALRKGEPIHPFHDMVMAPVSLPFATRVLEVVGAMKPDAVIQVSASSDVTYENVARYVAGRIGAPAELIRPISAKDSERAPEWLTAHTTLDTQRLQKDCKCTPPDVWDAVQCAIGS